MAGSKGGNSIKVTMSLKEATAWGERIQEVLKKNNYKSVLCGSIRRQKPFDIGDIDMVVERPVADAVLTIRDWAIRTGKQFKSETKNLNNSSKIAVFSVQGTPFNFFGASDQDWGAMVLFLTGSLLFNVILRGEAKKQGYKLNQNGLWLGEERIAGKDERQMFDALGLEWVEPQDRNLTTANKGIVTPIRYKEPV